MVDDLVGALRIVNQMLKEDIKDLGCVNNPQTTLMITDLTRYQTFRISIFLVREDTSNGGTRGSEGVNERIVYYKGHMNLKSLLDWLMVGRCDDNSKKDKERGKMLVTGKL